MEPPVISDARWYDASAAPARVRVAVEPHLEQEIGRRTIAEARNPPDLGQVRRQRLAHEILAAEAVAAAGGAHAAHDRLAETGREIVRGDADVEGLAAGITADLMRRRCSRTKGRETTVRVGAFAIGKPGRRAADRRPTGMIAEIDRPRPAVELRGDGEAVAPGLAGSGRDTAGKAGLAGKFGLPPGGQALAEGDANRAVGRKLGAGRAGGTSPAVAEMTAGPFGQAGKAEPGGTIGRRPGPGPSRRRRGRNRFGSWPARSASA